MKITAQGRTRSAAVAGGFYPGSERGLRRAVERYLEEAVALEDLGNPKALIVPHAGYVYSGAVAAAGYRALLPRRTEITRVVLLGPSHRVPLAGLAVSSADAFETPLGRVPVDRDSVERLLGMPQIQELDAAHAAEHCLEVQLPFLQCVIERFSIVPLVVGDVPTRQVAEVLAACWGGEETVIVISSDLSHYFDYDTARAKDGETARAIEQLEPAQLDRDAACGRMPLRGLLYVAKQRGLEARRLTLCNSGDTAGPRDSVVGYGAWAIV